VPLCKKGSFAASHGFWHINSFYLVEFLRIQSISRSNMTKCRIVTVQL